MRKLITTAAFLTALLPVVAHAEDAKTFQHERDTYVYQTAPGRDGTTVITGRRVGGERFRLVVSGARVSGTVGATPVSFRVAQGSGLSELAAN